MEPARLQGRTYGSDLRLIVSAFVEERVAEPRTAALAVLQPGFRPVDVRHIFCRGQLIQVAVRETVIGDHVPRRDISGNALFTADAVVMSQLAGDDEEGRLLHLGRFQSGDQALRPLVRRDEGAATAGNVVETECDTLLRLCSRPAGDQERDEQQDPHQVVRRKSE